jgi:AmmeMemoRadiSam system protein B
MRNWQKMAVAAMLSIGLVACGNLQVTNQVTLEYKAAIIPHHLFVSGYMRDIYERIGSEEVKRVVLISPDHFGIGRSDVSSLEGELVWEDVALGIDEAFVQELVEREVLGIYPPVFKLEHGVGVHLSFIEEHFPAAKVVPITIKQGSDEAGLEALVDELTAVLADDSAETIFIASIDFTHYVAEKIAAVNDARTIEWLEQWGAGEVDVELAEVRKLAVTLGGDHEDGVAMDSPESLYVLLRLMEEFGERGFELMKRSSTNALMESNSPLDNTSHIFGLFPAR